MRQTNNFNQSRPQQRGYNNRDGRPQQRGNGGGDSYPNAPQRSREVRKVKLTTNQFQVKVDQNLVVYMYSIQFSPDNLDQSTKETVLNEAGKQLCRVFTNDYAYTGETLYSIDKLEQSVDIRVPLRSELSVDLRIDHASADESPLRSLLEVNAGEIHSMLTQFISTIISKAFKANNMEQVGRTGKFFDKSKAKQITCGRDGDKLNLYPGYKATSWTYNDAIYLNIDSCSRFVPQISAMSSLQKEKDNFTRMRRFDM
jgi:hypothetical protein